MAIKSLVSLYSLQYQYLTGKMDLEAILKYMKDLDVDGIELLPDQMIPGAPEPSEETLAKWDELMKKYPIGHICVNKEETFVCGCGKLKNMHSMPQQTQNSFLQRLEMMQECMGL